MVRIALAVFATNFPSRFYWTGGAFLRWDWLFYYVGGACLLKKEKPFLAGLFFAGLGSTVFCCLWFKSGFIPKALAAWGVFASALLGGCAFTFGGGGGRSSQSSRPRTALPRCTGADASALP